LVLAPGTSEDDWPFGQECGACGKFFSTRQKLSTVATDTIAYVITDQNGLAATRTRTVIVGPAAAPSIALMHRPAAALFFASQIGKARWSSSA
jgi:hypothetical protein